MNSTAKYPEYKASSTPIIIPPNTISRSSIICTSNLNTLDLCITDNLASSEMVPEFNLDASVEIVMPYKESFIRARRRLVEMLEWYRDKASENDIPDTYKSLNPDGDEIELLALVPEMLDEGLIGPCFSDKIEIIKKALREILDVWLHNYGIETINVAMNMLSTQVGRLTFPGLGRDDFAVDRNRQAQRLHAFWVSPVAEEDAIAPIETDVLKRFWREINFNHQTCGCRSCLVTTGRA